MYKQNQILERVVTQLEKQNEILQKNHDDLIHTLNAPNNIMSQACENVFNQCTK